ncbi:class I tRNA ligase family protein, partial [Candidatus Saccharibacteria bacterium]|nr:class I tRNA ligase family protein [Candidatus Saccharibacteria bacterium]
APEHEILNRLSISKEAKDYIAKSKRKTELERKAEAKTKTGVFSGHYAINPATKAKIPIWVADYVLMSYGTGAIMAVPAHDQRDHEFAVAHKLPVQTVILEDFGQPLPDEEYVEGAVVVPYNPKTGKFLALDKWVNGVGLVGGGLDKNESFEACAKRELAEETGITKIEQWVKLGEPVYSHYYNNLKDVNKRSLGQGYLAVVSDDKITGAKPESHETFVPAWMGMPEIRRGIEKLRATKGGGGVDHWLAMCDRAEEAAKALKADQEYIAGPYDGEGIVVSSGKYDGLSSAQAREKMTKDFGQEHVQYRLRDWLISRQRYWGTPIPVVYCDKCGIQPVAESELPIKLPEEVEFEPTGQSPLAKDPKFVNTKCTNCGGPAKRETDTMDTFVDSSWYFLRYLDPKNDKAIFSTQLINKWAPVDHYIGGIEHAILHLLYARFITKFMSDHHGLAFDEPFKKLTNQGIILGPDGHKMSKSRGNVINPDEQVESYGADSLRLYMMFMGPYDEGGPYNLGGIAGTRRFLDRLWALVQEYLDEAKSKKQKAKSNDELAIEIKRVTHKTVKKVTNDLETVSFNTAIAAMMSCVNELYKLKSVKNFRLAPVAWQDSLIVLAQLLAPLAPHIAEQLWSELGQSGSVHASHWPAWDKSLVQDELLTLAVQINGKVRAEIRVSSDASQAEAIKLAKAEPRIVKLIAGQTVKKIVYVPGRLVSLVL